MQVWCNCQLVCFQTPSWRVEGLFLCHVLWIVYIYQNLDQVCQSSVLSAVREIMRNSAILKCKNGAFMCAQQLGLLGNTNTTWTMKMSESFICECWCKWSYIEMQQHGQQQQASYCTALASECWRYHSNGVTMQTLCNLVSFSMMDDARWSRQWYSHNIGVFSQKTSIDRKKQQIQCVTYGTSTWNNWYLQLKLLCSWTNCYCSLNFCAAPSLSESVCAVADSRLLLSQMKEV